MNLLVLEKIIDSKWACLLEFELMSAATVGAVHLTNMMLGLQLPMGAGV